jgi:hypothetical protein
MTDLLKGRYKPKPVMKKMGRKEFNYIAYCERYYFLNNSGFPSPEQAAKDLRYSVSEINVFLQNRNVIAALDRRGLPYITAGAQTNGELTSIQHAAALTVANFADERPIAQKLDELGVNPTQYYAWLDNPKFQKFVSDRADKNLKNVRPEAITEFAKLVRKGDFNALKYYFEATGEFRSQDTPDVSKLLQLVIEIIVKHVKDPAVLSRIGADLLAAAPGVSNTIIVDGETLIEDSIIEEIVEADAVNDNRMIGSGPKVTISTAERGNIFTSRGAQNIGGTI